MKKISSLIVLFLFIFLVGCNEKTDRKTSKISPIASDSTAIQGGKYDSVDPELLSKKCQKNSDGNYVCPEGVLPKRPTDSASRAKMGLPPLPKLLTERSSKTVACFDLPTKDSIKKCVCSIYSSGSITYNGVKIDCNGIL